ncbi:MAG: XRE family transcriptional regulator [Acidimicrobiia bacterium]|nr:MAG: XRE family transcriptional regulator [Acidimicrobiia bacterium]
MSNESELPRKFREKAGDVRPETTDERLGAWVAATRERKGMSQTALGALLNPPISRQGVGHLERGRAPWTVSRWNEVCVLLGETPPVEGPLQ